MQALQWSPCFSHSAMQASQHFTHNAQISSQNCESLAHNLAHKAQISAQSRQVFKHSTIPPIVMHIVVHFSHSIMQAKQASIHIFLSFIVYFCLNCKNYCLKKLLKFKTQSAACGFVTGIIIGKK